VRRPPRRAAACLIIQSASFSGAVGSTSGPQPFRDALVVREQQPTLWGYAPTYADIEIRMRARVDAAAMFAFWLAGIEDSPERSGEICVAEVFGSSIRDGRAEVGMGIHLVHRIDQSPDYPMQLMIGVFDFAARRRPGDPSFVPELVLSQVRGRPRDPPGDQTWHEGGRPMSASDAEAIVRRFNDRIGARDLEGPASLMTEDHTFIDSAGVSFRGKEEALAAWRGFFESFPDYRNDFEWLTTK
jgi:hypothetical protein